MGDYALDRGITGGAQPVCNDGVYLHKLVSVRRSLRGWFGNERETCGRSPWCLLLSLLIGVDDVKS